MNATCTRVHKVMTTDQRNEDGGICSIGGTSSEFGYGQSNACTVLHFAHTSRHKLSLAMSPTSRCSSNACERYTYIVNIRLYPAADCIIGMLLR